MNDKTTWFLALSAVIALFLVYASGQWIVIGGHILPVETVKLDPPMDNSIGQMESNQSVYFAHDYLAGKYIAPLKMNDEVTVINKFVVTKYRVYDTVLYSRQVTQNIAYDNFPDMILQTCVGSKILIVKLMEEK